AIGEQVKTTHKLFHVLCGLFCDDKCLFFIVPKEIVYVILKYVNVRLEIKGVFQRKWEVEFKRARGIEWDDRNRRMFVTDTTSGKNALRIFDKKGKQLGSVTSYYLKNPTG